MGTIGDRPKLLRTVTPIDPCNLMRRTMVDFLVKCLQYGNFGCNMHYCTFFNFPNAIATVRRFKGL